MHWLLCQTDEINTIFQPFISYTYEGTGEFLYYCLYLLIDTNIQIPMLPVPSALQIDFGV